MHPAQKRREKKKGNRKKKEARKEGRRRKEETRAENCTKTPVCEQVGMRKREKKERNMYGEMKKITKRINTTQKDMNEIQEFSVLAAAAAAAFFAPEK